MQSMAPAIQPPTPDTEPVPETIRPRPNKRQLVRCPVPDLPASLVIQGRDYSVVIRDISATGTLVRGALPGLSYGMPIHFNACLPPHGTLSVDGHVMRCDPAEGGHTIGIHFHSLDTPAMRVLLRFLAQVWEE